MHHTESKAIAGELNDILDFVKASRKLDQADGSDETDGRLPLHGMSSVASSRRGANEDELSQDDNEERLEFAHAQSAAAKGKLLDIIDYIKKSEELDQGAGRDEIDGRLPVRPGSGVSSKRGAYDEEQLSQEKNEGRLGMAVAESTGIEGEVKDILDFIVAMRKFKREQGGESTQTSPGGDTNTRHATGDLNMAWQSGQEGDVETDVSDDATSWDANSNEVLGSNRQKISSLFEEWMHQRLNQTSSTRHRSKHGSTTTRRYIPTPMPYIIPIRNNNTRLGSRYQTWRRSPSFWMPLVQMGYQYLKSKLEKARKDASKES